MKPNAVMAWAARYAFCDPLWRGRARLIVDAELEAVLRGTVERGGDGPWMALLESLLPRQRSVATWMVVGSEPTARLLAPHFAGVRFVAADAIDDRFARLPWETALLTLDRRVESAAVATAPARLGVGSRTVEALLVDVAAACGPGRVAVIAEMGPDVDYEGFVELLRPTFGEARVYGGYAPGMLAFAEFVPADDTVAGEFDTDDDDPQTFRLRPASQREPDAEPWDEGDAADEDEDGVPLAFDNTLGPQVPDYSLWIGVVGSASEFAEGLTLVELPGGDALGPAVAADDDEVAPHDSAAAPSDGLRRQLHETRKAAEFGALERQRLVERVDAVEAENAGLRDAVGQLREQLAGALDPAVAGERLDAALAREQSLRWRASALEREVAELRVRPVDELTVELEAMRAKLEAALASAHRAPVRDVSPRAPQPKPAASPVVPSGSVRGSNPDLARRIGSRRPGSGRTAALRVVEGLVRRIDHGSVERNSLRRELLALRRRLRG